MASLGKLQAAQIRFEAVEDAPNAGVLCALPALLALGLLRHSHESLSLPAGFYPLETIFLSISFLALARVPSLEALRYEPPGQWGKILGLDRIPEVRTLRAKLDLLCQDGKPVREWSLTLAAECAQPQVQTVATYEQEKGKLLEQIDQQQSKLAQLKRERKETPRHIALKDLPEPERFGQLLVTKKHFEDTIKLIAYRAETATVALLREKLTRSDDGRSVARQVFESAADLRPNPEQKTLTVRLHRLSSGAHDQALEHMCAELTATETLYPGTELRLIFEPVGSTRFPRGQES